MNELHCPACGSSETEAAASSDYIPSDLPNARCAACGWQGYEEELLTAQDLRDNAGCDEFHRRQDEGRVA